MAQLLLSLGPPIEEPSSGRAVWERNNGVACDVAFNANPNKLRVIAGTEGVAQGQNVGDFIVKNIQTKKMSLAVKTDF